MTMNKTQPPLETNPEKIIDDFIFKCKLLKIEEEIKKEIRKMTGKYLSQFNILDKHSK